MMSRCTTQLVVIAFVALFAAGCSQETSTPLAQPISAQVAPNEFDGDPKVPGTTEPRPVAKVDNNLASQKEALPEKKEPIEAAFEPPYPHRANPFQQPNVEQIARSGLLESTGGVIQLKGFTNNGQSRVLLAMDDHLAPLAEGDEWFGVKIIEISPPRVILQRGRIRWTESLFERRYGATDAMPTHTQSISREGSDANVDS